MATITASLERSLQNFSLNQTTKTRHHKSSIDDGGGGGDGLGRSASSDTPKTIHYHKNDYQNSPKNYDDAVTLSNTSYSDDNSNYVELNSHVSLPYHWEQCLDLKTGEIYYINWSNGMKAKEDPRTNATGYNGDYSSSDQDDDHDHDDHDDHDLESKCYDSEGSSTESSPCSSTIKESNFRLIKKQQELNYQDSVLVVAGCKSCLMYYMVPKHVEDCPKCSGQLLHFTTNNSSP